MENVYIYYIKIRKQNKQQKSDDAMVDTSAIDIKIARERESKVKEKKQMYK